MEPRDNTFRRDCTVAHFWDIAWDHWIGHWIYLLRESLITLVVIDPGVELRFNAGTSGWDREGFCHMISLMFVSLCFRVNPGHCICLDLLMCIADHMWSIMKHRNSASLSGLYSHENYISWKLEVIRNSLGYKDKYWLISEDIYPGTFTRIHSQQVVCVYKHNGEERIGLKKLDTMAFPYQSSNKLHWFEMLQHGMEFPVHWLRGGDGR